jgi:hypothetical protein
VTFNEEDASCQYTNYAVSSIKNSRKYQGVQYDCLFSKTFRTNRQSIDIYCDGNQYLQENGHRFVSSQSQSFSNVRAQSTYQQLDPVNKSVTRIDNHRHHYSELNQYYQGKCSQQSSHPENTSRFKTQYLQCLQLFKIVHFQLLWVSMLTELFFLHQIVL